MCLPDPQSKPDSTPVNIPPGLTYTFAGRDGVMMKRFVLVLLLCLGPVWAKSGDKHRDKKNIQQFCVKKNGDKR